MWLRTLLLALVLACASNDSPGQVVYSAPNENGQDATAVPVAPFNDRRLQAMEQLPDGILLVLARPDIKDYRESGFHQDLNFYYFTGIDDLTNAILAIDGQRKESWLFVQTITSRLSVLAGTSLPGSIEEYAKGMGAERSVDFVVDWNRFDQFIEERGDATLYVAGSVDSAAPSTPTGMLPVVDAEVLWYESLRSRWPTRTIESAFDTVGRLRAVKDAVEIAALRAAGAASVDGVLAGLAAIGSGVDQRAAEAAVIEACLTAGGDGISFWPWLMSGPNAVFPKVYEAFGDYRHLGRVMQDGELVRIDIGCEYDHYQGDLGRTAPVSGKFSPGQREAWDLLIAGYRGGLAAMKDGVPWDDVIAASRSAVEARLANEATSPRTEHGRKAAAVLIDADKSKWHYHAIGLWASEPAPPILRSGMVIDFEPMFAIDGQAYYLEDMILITPIGHEILTPGLPYTALEIESAMSTLASDPDN